MGPKKRFGLLMDSSSDRLTSYGPSQVVFNIDLLRQNNSKLIDFGNDHIERLIICFKPALQLAGCWVDDILPQSPSVRIMFNSQFHDKVNSSFLRMFLFKDPYTSDLKDTLHLTEMLLVLPIAAAGCKQMVSSQNRIKSNLRASFEDLITGTPNQISAQG